VLASSDGRTTILVRDRRVPKRQQTVKIEPLDRLHRAPFLQPSANRRQPDGIEDRDRRGVQERQVAEPVAQPIVTDRRFRIDLLLLREPGERRLLVADLIDQL
jgi:hypothetical protein